MGESPLGDGHRECTLDLQSPSLHLSPSIEEGLEELFGEGPLCEPSLPRMDSMDSDTTMPVALSSAEHANETDTTMPAATPSAELSAEHAAQLVALSQDGMARMVDGNISWNNPAFTAMAETLSPGDLTTGMETLRVHFLQVVQSSVQRQLIQIPGRSCVLSAQSVIKCVSGAATIPQYL